MDYHRIEEELRLKNAEPAFPPCGLSWSRPLPSKTTEGDGRTDGGTAGNNFVAIPSLSVSPAAVPLPERRRRRGGLEK